MVNGLKEGIKIEGHIGTWSVVDTGVYRGTHIRLLEHEEYGTDAELLIVDQEGKKLAETNDLDWWDPIYD